MKKIKIVDLVMNVYGKINDIGENIKNYVEDSKYGYYVYIDNWHENEIISKCMCKLGRHDYEFEGMGDNGYGKLYCFYCMKKKLSKSL